LSGAGLPRGAATRSNAALGPLLRHVAPELVRRAAPTPVDRETRRVAEAIIDDVRAHGDEAVRAHAERLDGLARGAPLVLGRDVLAAAARDLDTESLALLQRVAARIRAFAGAQRASLKELELALGEPHGGARAGQRIVPVERAGCYAPGGRYPLPSSVLMTAVTARVAGVHEVVVATPRPSQVMLAAAHVAGADLVLAAGGAQAIAALALGAGVPRVDLVVGPGNRFVTAAKQLLCGEVGIDLPAGPSELVVVADSSADPRLVAADLLAQAEHDPAARPILVAVADGVCGTGQHSGGARTAVQLVAEVESELALQLATLSTAEVARAALAGGFVVVVRDVDEALAVVETLAPEHLQLAMREPATFEARVRHCGAAFLGEASAEVFGDYGAGPNHVLPTGGAARWSGGLSVHTFLRARTWLSVVDVDQALRRDTVALARLEGLEAHARAAEARH
jgi:histidinol dehydrogenase